MIPALPYRVYLPDLLSWRPRGVLLLLACLLLAGCQSVPPLTSAVFEGDSAKIRQLVNEGEPLDPPEPAALSPLWHAVARQDLHTVKLLVELGAQVDRPNGSLGERPLMLALKNNQQTMVDYLLAQGADISRPAGFGQVPLVYAVQSGNMALVDKLLARGARPDPDAASLKAGAFTPLTMAASTGRNDLLQRLLAVGADPDLTDGRDWTPLYTAADGGKLEAVQSLLAAGADVNKPTSKGFAPLYGAADKGRAEVVEALLAAGARVDDHSDGWTPLYAAAFDNAIATVKLLLAAGADPNSANGDNGWTPLAVAAEKNYDELVVLLLQAGADPNLKTGHGYTALYQAVVSDKDTRPVMKLLVAAGADPNTRVNNQYKWTPLHRAANSGYYDTTETLLQLGANPALGDTDGDTALDLAVDQGYEKTSAALRRYGGPTSRSGSSSGSSDGALFGKLIASAGLVAVGMQADLPTEQALQVATAATRDIWLEDGQGTNLAQLQQQTLAASTQGTAAGRVSAANSGGNASHGPKKPLRNQGVCSVYTIDNFRSTDLIGEPQIDTQCATGIVHYRTYLDNHGHPDASAAELEKVYRLHVLAMENADKLDKATRM